MLTMRAKIPMPFAHCGSPRPAADRAGQCFSGCLGFRGGDHRLPTTQVIVGFGFHSAIFLIGFAFGLATPSLIDDPYFSSIVLAADDFSKVGCYSLFGFPINQTNGEGLYVASGFVH